MIISLLLYKCVTIRMICELCLSAVGSYYTGQTFQGRVSGVGSVPVVGQPSATIGRQQSQINNRCCAGTQAGLFAGAGAAGQQRVQRTDQEGVPEDPVRGGRGCSWTGANQRQTGAEKIVRRIFPTAGGQVHG